MDNFPQNVDNFLIRGENVDNFLIVIHRVWITLFAHTIPTISEFVRQFHFIPGPPYYSSSMTSLFFPLSILAHRVDFVNPKTRYVILSHGKKKRPVRYWTSLLRLDNYTLYTSLISFTTSFPFNSSLS